MKKILTKCILIIGVFQACTSNTKKTNNHTIDKANRTYDLFAEPDEINDTQQSLSLEEAIHFSEEVIVVNHIEEIENSTERTGNAFYLYRINSGVSKKTEEDSEINFPLLFLSEQKLLHSNALKDSTYIFLTPLEEYDMLKSHSIIKYKWTENAPLISF